MRIISLYFSRVTCIENVIKKYIEFLSAQHFDINVRSTRVGQLSQRLSDFSVLCVIVYFSIRASISLSDNTSSSSVITCNENHKTITPILIVSDIIGRSNSIELLYDPNKINDYWPT